MTVWKRKAPALLEFPPVMASESIFQLADNGQLASLRKKTGKVRWKRKLGRLAASAPALGGGRVYVTLLDGGRGRRPRPGRRAAAAQRPRRWSRTLPSRSESSPLLHGGRLYFGSENGTLYCLDADNGKVIWTYRAAGAIKGSPTLADGKLFFGDYGGRVQAVRRRTAGGCGRAAVRGRFYATAAVAGRRVIIGSTGGARVLVLDPQRAAAVVASDRALRLRLGGRAPACAGAARPRSSAPTTAASTRSTRATAGCAGPTTRAATSPARATVIGKVVYFADRIHRRTIGLNTRTGRVAFRKEQGAYDPVVSDGKHLYLTGHHTLTALRPRKRGR